MRELINSKILFSGVQKIAISIVVGWSITAGAVPTVFRAAGDIGAGIAGFQTALGDPNNGNAPGPIANGRRQINWDAGIVPFDMPADFFNSAPTTRGAVFSTEGPGFRVSNDSEGINDNEFDTLNPTYSDQFTTFSSPRLFTPFGSNVLDVNFFVPASNTQAVVSGFGAIFTDVDLNDSTQLEYFDLNNNLLLSEFVDPDPQGLSFLGATFTDNSIGRVRITSGNALIGLDDDPTNGVDIVVMDDFLYSEPNAADVVTPEPSTFALMGVGISALFVGYRRKRLNK